MVRKTRPENPSESDDDAPEVISKSTSKANAKRDQKSLRAFEAEEKARQKARNRERDRKLKERSKATKSEGSNVKRRKGVEVEDGEGNGIGVGEGSDDEGISATEARMLRAMKDAAEEEGEDSDGSEYAESFEGFGGIQGSRGSVEDSELDDDDDDDGEMSAEDLEADPEPMLEDDGMDDEDEDEDSFPLPLSTNSKDTRKSDYLDDSIFAEAFASQKSQAPPDKKGIIPKKHETLKKRRRKPLARAKDLVIGGRTIRTLAPLSDPRSQSTARALPSARVRKFVDQSLAIKGKQAARKAKMRGWERRPANIGVMKVDGAPRGFARQAK